MKFEKELIRATVVFLLKNDKVLLAIKTRHIAEGMWNGYGGKINLGERPKESAVREINEETKGVIIRAKDLVKIAEVNCHNLKSDGQKFICRLHVYKAWKWRGNIKASSEMVCPTWFNRNEIPWDEMIPTDRDWLPLALAGKKIRASVYLGPFQRTKIRETELWEIKKF